jgi:hypothetical protein
MNNLIMKNISNENNEKENLRYIEAHKNTLVSELI